MSTETVNILALILGFLALLVTVGGIILTIWFTERLSKRTDKLIQSEDEKAKRMIEEGNERTQRLIEEGNARTQRMIEEGSRRLEVMLKETQRMIDEGKRETQRMIDEGRKETRELISYMVKILEGMEKRAEERHKELLFK